MRDYGITYLFHDCYARAYVYPDKLLTHRHASVEWVMGRYLIPDTVLRDSRQK